eukprot:TRINITY_DN7033_c0_g2_i2.p1 TRINITY_DN7033_c0_g2~~TRINITY_DN7033_c0_g2_i2.p1  ORF type:complete len:158 (+),score=25.47 TRINITY_DN7033_c0_g2_i2:41-514(+)
MGKPYDPEEGEVVPRNKPSFQRPLPVNSIFQSSLLDAKQPTGSKPPQLNSIKLDTKPSHQRPEISSKFLSRDVVEISSLEWERQSEDHSRSRPLNFDQEDKNYHSMTQTLKKNSSSLFTSEANAHGRNALQNMIPERSETSFEHLRKNPVTHFFNNA